MAPLDSTAFSPPAGRGREPRRSRRPSQPPEPMLVCPNCGAGLTERKCKLLCPNRLCGYYLSCSDFY